MRKSESIGRPIVRRNSINLFWRKQTEELLRHSHHDVLVGIQIEFRYDRTANPCLSDYKKALEPKMVSPPVSTRIEKRKSVSCLWVN